MSESGMSSTFNQNSLVLFSWRTASHLVPLLAEKNLELLIVASLHPSVPHCKDFLVQPKFAIKVDMLINIGKVL